ncbi:response regulator [Arenibacter sp. 6A1]|uniref:response regulator n=1 Tax=Arenibacter sp. 6A1 TaxID=2720391 RepID=UPI001446090C|nr:response regulator [Arenibacter sp. 6A1]NKI25736.1 response regulator [Arenibacter sp. 6A1]
MNHKNVLVVENSILDAILIKEAFNHKGIPCNVHLAQSGKEAMEFFKEQGLTLFSNSLDLVLINEELIQLGEVDLIASIKEKAATMVPIIVLTDTKDQSQQSQVPGANSYLAKPLEVTDFVNMINKVKNYWLEVAC